MNRFRYLAIGMLLIIALAASAEQTAPATAGSGPQPQSQNSPSKLDQHLQALTESLNLTADQQAKIRPILQEFLDSRQKVLEDQSLTDDARRERIKDLHAKADKQARTFLNNEQKKKLDEMEQETHHQ